MQEWILDIIQSLGVLGIALLMLLENIFPPLPSEFIMPLAGYLSARGAMSFTGAIAAGAVGSLLGTFVWYIVGRRVGEERLAAWIEAHGVWLGLRREDIEKAQRFFERHGEGAVFFGRLLPVVRTLISVPAGFSRMAVGSFLLYSAVGTALWTGALAYAGRFLGRNFPQIQQYLGIITWIILGGAVLWYVVRVIRLKRAV